MLKSCPRCGRIHKLAEDCPLKLAYAAKRDTEGERFRKTARWARKSKQIRERDLHLCRVCLAAGVYEYMGLSVHHIIPLYEDYGKRLDDDNLITLCARCHTAADAGGIPRARLRELVIRRSMNPPRG